MKKSLLTFIFFFATILTFAQKIKYVNTQELNIRSGAGTRFSIVEKILQGQKVTVLSARGRWSEIELESGTKGYVSTKFLSNDVREISNKKKSWEGYIITIGLVLFVLYKIVKFLIGIIPSSNSFRERESVDKKTETKPSHNLSVQKFYCKCCGMEFTSIRNLTSNSCFNNPSKKHQLFEGELSDIYYCNCCGQEFNNLRNLTANHCYNSPTQKHQPYEGSRKTRYNCKDCGQEFTTIRNLTSNHCFNSPTQKHRPVK